MICSLHFLIAIALLLSGYCGSFHYLHISHSFDVQNNSSFTVSHNKLDLSAEYFIAEASACIFSIAYLSFFYSDSVESEKISQTILSSSYDTGTDDPLSDTDQSKLSSILMLSEMMYWGFVIASSYAAIASNTGELYTIEVLYLRVTVHLFSMYTICSQVNTKRRIDLISSLAFMVFIGETFVDISMTVTQMNLVMAYFHRFLDFLLLLGHRWDANPSLEVILNCRLFYIAMGGTLLHFDMGMSKG
jgi:hypothetical protein